MAALQIIIVIVAFLKLIDGAFHVSKVGGVKISAIDRCQLHTVSCGLRSGVGGKLWKTLLLVKVQVFGHFLVLYSNLEVLQNLRKIFAHFCKHPGSACPQSLQDELYIPVLMSGHAMEEEIVSKRKVFCMVGCRL
jgi:hypothetical protein